MEEERVKFSSDWEHLPGTPVAYRKKIGNFELRALETEGYCDTCKKKGPGFSLQTLDSKGAYIGRSGAYWCPTCGEGMSPEHYEKFVTSELITPEM